MNVSRAVAILVAAGQGERLAQATAGRPKQFSELAEIPIFIWSLTTIAIHGQIDQVIVTVPSGWQNEANELIAKYIPQAKRKISIIAGGKTRQESVWLALEELSMANIVPSHVLIHDAVRPFVTTDSIDLILEKLEQCEAVTIGLPLSDSIKRIGKGQIIEDLDRNIFALVQTPQAAQFDTMLKAHRHARVQQHQCTDDAAIMKFFGKLVSIVPGSRLNLKITEPEDLLIAQALVETNKWQPGKIAMEKDLVSI